MVTKTIQIQLELELILQSKNSLSTQMHLIHCMCEISYVINTAQLCINREVTYNP